ncbi:Protein AEXR-1, partial [Aphelenchoides avenae]
MPVSFLTFEAVVQYILLVSSVPATAANIVVVICAYKLLRQSGDTMHVFVISTALADLVVTAFHHPYLLLALRHRLPSQVIACAITQSIELVGMAVSGISVTFLNADKFIYFRWPLKYLTLSWRRSVVLSLVAVVLIVVVVTLMWIFRVVFIGRDEICALKATIESGALAAYEVFVILFCLAPVASSLLLSIYLFQLTRRRRIRSTASSLGGNASALKLKSLLLIFATTLWTAVSLLPYSVNWLAIQYFFVSRMHECSARRPGAIIARTLLFLVYFNP